RYVVTPPPRLSALPFFSTYGPHPDVPSFPTRRSSDLIPDYIFPEGAMEGDPRVDPANYTTDIESPEFRKSKWLITRANKAGTNWMDEIFDPAPIQNHQLKVSGGSESARYAMSLNYFNQDGILIHTGYKRYSVRANTEFNVTRAIRVGENFQVAYG